MTDFPNVEQGVAAAFAAIPTRQRDLLLGIRDRILETATELDIRVREELRWGQPAYLSPKGTTIRLGVSKSGDAALFAHCATSVISDYASLVPDARIEPKRAVLLGDVDEARGQPLELLIRAALTYHLKR